MRIKQSTVFNKITEKGSFTQNSTIKDVATKLVNYGSDHLPISLNIDNNYKIITWNCLTNIGIRHSFKGNDHPLRLLKDNTFDRVDRVEKTIKFLANMGFIVCLQELDNDIISRFVNKEYKKGEKIYINYSSFGIKKNIIRVGYVYSEKFYEDCRDSTDYSNDVMLGNDYNKQLYVKTWKNVLTNKKFIIANVHMFSKIKKESYESAYKILKNGINVLCEESAKRKLCAFVTGDFNTNDNIISNINGKFKKLTSDNFTHISAGKKLVYYDAIYGAEH